jgi:spore coat protein B
MDKASMDSLVGRSVRVDRGGPESRTGKLLSVQNDYFVLYSENEGIVYYKKDHVKSLTLDSREVSDVYESNEGEQQQPVLQYFEADSFTSVLQSMYLYSVQINRGGPEKIEGVIVDASDDEVTLVVDKEVVKILPFHIRNISYSLKNDNNEQNNNSNNNNNKGNRNRNSRNSRR